MRIIAASLLAAMVAGAAPAAPPANPTPPQLTLELTDGSRLVCTSAVDRLRLQAEHSALEIKLALIQRIEFGPDQRPAKVSLANGDRVSGQLALADFKVQTSFGDVRVPLSAVSRLLVGGGGLALFFGPGARAVADDAFLPWGNTPLSYSIWGKLPPFDGQAHVAFVIGAQERYFDRMALYLSPVNSWYLMISEVYGSNVQFTRHNDQPCAEQAGQWVHYCGVYDGQSLTTYRDGVRMRSNPMKLNRLAQGKFAVGNHNLEASAPFNEALSDLRIWDRALTAEEVAQVHAGQEVAAGLIGHWPMNDGGGPVLRDTSGQNHDLTIEGHPTWVEGPPAPGAPPKPAGP